MLHSPCIKCKCFAKPEVSLCKARCDASQRQKCRFAKLPSSVGANLGNGDYCLQSFIRLIYYASLLEGLQVLVQLSTKCLCQDSLV